MTILALEKQNIRYFPLSRVPMRWYYYVLTDILELQFTDDQIQPFQAYNPITSVNSECQATVTTSSFRTFPATLQDPRCPLNSQSLFSVPSMLQPQATINLLSVSRDLSFLATSFKWNHIMGGLPHLASFTAHNISEAHLCCSTYQYFISLYG